MADSGPFAVIGRVVKTHGLKGEVSVVPAAETSLSSLIGVVVWFVPPSENVRSARIASVRTGPKGELVSFDEVSTIEQASALVTREILVRREDLPAEWEEALTEIVDDVGLTVTDSVHGLLGEVVEVIETGANDVWVVHGPFGEVLIPVIDDVIGRVDDDARTANVTLLPGLLPGEEADQ